MLNALRTLKAQAPIPVFSSTPPYSLRRRTCGIRFQHAAAGNSFPDMDKRMEDQSQSKHPREEHMASFGEGYATRSDEEGFGGVYGENLQLPKKEEEKIVHGEVPEFDSNQGSEVKEKEHSRHQKGGSGAT